MDRDVKTPEIASIACPRCHKICTDPIDLHVIPLWGYGTCCDHQMLDQDLDQDYGPMDFEEKEQ